MNKSAAIIFCAILSLYSYTCFSETIFSDSLNAKQEVDTARIDITLPAGYRWSTVNEGDTLRFTLGTIGNYDSVRFNMQDDKDTGIRLDSLGNLSWSPSYDFVDRLEETKAIQVIFKAESPTGEQGARQVEFTVRHVNRAPKVGELKNFYIQYNVENKYQIDMNSVKDEDNDPLIFKPILAKMPEGAQLSENGVFTWKPSLTQFYNLKEDPLVVPFIVEDQPHKSQETGQLTISATQMDLPPEISMVPKTTLIRAKENETVNLKFYLSDQNGDDDIQDFGFISDDIRVPQSALINNSVTSYEFIWTPGYNFIMDNQDSLTIELTFFVLDKTKKRSERRIKVIVENAENIVARERMLYSQYRSGLVRVWDLIEQLDDKEKELRRELKKARNGKKNRAIINASLGGITGISPVIVQEPDQQRAIAAVGGTTTLTMGTLDATELIGKAPDKLLERLNYVAEKRNELQIMGDIFARKFALPASRRNDSFKNDLDRLLSLLTIKNVASLELDASWRNKKKVSDGNIKNTFNDFNPFEG